MTESRPQVVIFGAGVTGLTAAHELVERGWRVTVVEKEIDPLDADQCAVGGIAKTQWAAYQPNSDAAATTPTEARPLVPTIRLRLDHESGAPTANPFEELFDIGSRIYWTRLCGRIAAIKPAVPDLLVSFCPPTKDAELHGVHSIADRIKHELDQLIDSKATTVRVDADESVPLGAWQIETDLRDRMGPGGVPSDFAGVLPGEHGFRFFPGFYRHIFDTLRRIPVRAPGTNYEDAFRTVFDNLLPTDANWLAITDGRYRPDSAVLHAKDGNNVVKFQRKLPRSLREVFDATEALQTQLGYTARDVELLKLRLFKYMTSCRARRKAEYEDISWADFMGLSDLSETCRRDMERAPQLLAAMTATESDARTQGNIATQLLLDPINDEQRLDATLNAPTTVAWFAPWKEYLLSQGVQFVPGELTGFTVKNGELRPVVDVGEGNFAPALLRTAYYVLALPIQAWLPREDGSLIEDWQAARDHIKGDTDHVDVLANWLASQAHPGRTPLLKGLSGIQFYFDHDQMRRSGHTLFMDSQWRLTAISQASFWHRRRESFDGYRGILSIDIGILQRPPDADPTEERPWFWEVERQEVHKQVWAQVTSHFASLGSAGAPGYRIYHLDELIRYGGGAANDPLGTSKPIANLAPFLINGVSEWRLRAGWEHRHDPPSAAVELPSLARYQLMPRATPLTEKTQPRWVLAGTFMQTWTRATTMESANESARHAVNSLLAYDRTLSDRALTQTEYCPIWNPEEYEHADLRNWQELDARLFDWDGERLPHMVDILDLDTLSDEVLESGGLSGLVERLTRFAPKNYSGSTRQ